MRNKKQLYTFFSKWNIEIRKHDFSLHFFFFNFLSVYLSLQKIHAKIHKIAPN